MAELPAQKVHLAKASANTKRVFNSDMGWANQSAQESDEMGPIRVRTNSANVLNTFGLPVAIHINRHFHDFSCFVEVPQGVLLVKVSSE